MKRRKGRDRTDWDPYGERRMGRTLLVLCVISILFTGVVADQAYAASYSFSSSTIYADGTRTAKFTCNGMTGLCCEAGAYSTYSGTASLERMKNTTNAAHCAYYYGYKKGWTSGSNGHKLARLLSYCMGHGTGGEYKTSTMKSLLETAKKTDVPAGFQCWHCKPKGSSKQDFIVWKFPKGKLQVIKKSADTGISLQGTYTLAGMTIRIYSDAECKNCVKTLTTKKDGTTGGSFSLHVGTYYVKETSVPDGTGFELNETVYPIEVKAGKTSKVTLTNTPALGSIRVRKVTAGEGGTVEGFRFILTSKKSGKEYVLVTGPDGTAAAADLPFDSYTLAEDLTEEQEACYSDLTGVQTLTIAKGEGTQNITVERENEFEPQQKLKIIKRTGDGGPAGGFDFNISWLLDNSRTIEAEKIAAAADPQVELSDRQSLGIWQIADPESIAQINADAKKGSTGIYTVALKNTVTTVEDAAAPAGEPAAEPGKEPVAEPGEEPAAELGDEPAAGPGEEPDAEPAGEMGSDAVLDNGALTTDNGGTRTTSEEIEVQIPIELMPVSGAREEPGEEQPPEEVSPGAAGDGADAEAGDMSADPQDEGSGDTETESAEGDAENISGLAADTGSDDVSGEDPGEATEDPESGPILRAMPEPLTQGEQIETESGGYRVIFRALCFAGAADQGEETVTTNAAGQYISDHVLPGVYTVTEQMNERQKRRYREPQPQQKTVAADSEETIVFSFRNDPIRIPVRLQKASEDGQIDGIEFTVSGTPDFAEGPMEEITAQTGSDGIADLGMLYPGTYTVEETGFDGEAYVNNYPMEGRDGPAFAFTVTGEELTAAEIREGACLWLGGEAGAGQISKEKTAFHNTPYVELLLTKVDGVSRTFLPGAEFELTASGGETAARIRIGADEEGQPAADLLQTNGIVSAAGTDAKAEAESVVIGAAASEEADETDETEEARDYPCVVLRGLVAGQQYTLTETAAPEGFTPLKEPYHFSVTLDETGGPVLNTCDEYGRNIAAAARKGALVVVNDAPSITTEAWDNSTKDHIALAEGTVDLTDSCRITNLAEGETYTLIARLMDITEHQSGRTDDVTQISDADGPVTGRITFQAKAREETVQIPIRLKGAGLQGRRTVIYESLYQGDVSLAEAGEKTAISEEANPDNGSQTVRLPRIGTTASLRSPEVLGDLVKYCELLPGRTYRMTGTLMDRETGEAIDDDGSETVAETEFTADESGSGAVTVSFQIDPETLAEQGIEDLVVFEECTLLSTGGGRTGSLVAVHRDLEDEEQTVHLDAPETMLSEEPEKEPKKPGRSPSTGDTLRWPLLAVLTGASALLAMMSAGRLRRGKRRRAR